MSDYNNEPNHHNNNSFNPSWFIIILAFAIFWPVGVGLLIYKISQSTKTRGFSNQWLNNLEDLGHRYSNQTGYQSSETRQQQRAEKHAARQEYRRERAATRSSSTTRPDRTDRADRTGRADRKSPSSLRSGNFWSVLGGIVALCCGIATCQAFFTWMPGSLWLAMRDSIVPFICTGVGAGMFVWGRIKGRQARRLRKLINMVGNQKVIDIRALANAFPTSYGKACDDIQTLINGGYLGKNAYINMSTGQLILDSEGFQAPPQPAEPVPTADQDQQLLAEIRQVNDDIPGEEMSRKIDRIEECTQHILEYLKKHPEKSAELHTFLDYYLPTTLKLLHTYAELDLQGIQSENVTTTKERIESIMDSVVEGFEAQLDKLFEGDMLDISADIAVMEKMLSRDGLSGSMKIPKAPPIPDPVTVAQPYTPTLTLDPNGSGTATQRMDESR